MKSAFNFTLRSKLSFIFIILLVIIFIILSLTIYFSQRERLIQANDERMYSHLNDLTDMLDIHLKDKKGVENLSLNTIRAELNNSVLTEKLKKKKYLETGLIYLMAKDGTMLFHPDSQFIGQNMQKMNPDYFIYASKNIKGKFRYMVRGQQAWKWQYFQYYKPYNLYICTAFFESEFLSKPLAQIRNILLISLFIAISLAFFINYLLIGRITRPVNTIVDALKNLSQGKTIDKLEKKSNDEIGVIVDSLNQMIEGFTHYTQFAKEIGNQNFKADFEPLSKEDVLGNSLLQMRENLEKAEEEDIQRNWKIEGIANFSEILRNEQESLHQLGNIVLANLVSYVKANQGALFVLDDSKSDELFLEMIACFAYDRRRLLKKQIPINEGLAGRAFIDGKKIHLNNVPDDYLKVTSGLGEANPNNVLIIPLKVGEQVFGVIELASFTIFQDYQIDFIEQVATSIAATLSTTKANELTRKLLKESQEQAEIMQSQEEEMRQNLEELQATQEAAKRKEIEIQKLLTEAQEREKALEANLRVMEHFKKEMKS